MKQATDKFDRQINGIWVSIKHEAYLENTKRKAREQRIFDLTPEFWEQSRFKFHLSLTQENYVLYHEQVVGILMKYLDQGVIVDFKYVIMDEIIKAPAHKKDIKRFLNGDQFTIYIPVRSKINELLKLMSDINQFFKEKGMAPAETSDIAGRLTANISLRIEMEIHGVRVDAIIKNGENREEILQQVLNTPFYQLLFQHLNKKPMYSLMNTKKMLAVDYKPVIEIPSANPDPYQKFLAQNKETILGEMKKCHWSLAFDLEIMVPLEYRWRFVQDFIKDDHLRNMIDKNLISRILIFHQKDQSAFLIHCVNKKSLSDMAELMNKGEFTNPLVQNLNPETQVVLHKILASLNEKAKEYTDKIQAFIWNKEWIVKGLFGGEKITYKQTEKRVPAGVKSHWEDILLAQNGTISCLACLDRIISTSRACSAKQSHTPSWFQDPSTTAYYNMYFEENPFFTQEEIFSDESSQFSIEKLNDSPAPTLAKFP